MKIYQKCLFWFVVVLIVVSGCYIYGSLHQTTYRQYFPIHTALIASLLYIRDYGEPPRSVRDLIRTNCVEQESDDEHGFISPYMIWPTCKKTISYEFIFHFPVMLMNWKLKMAD